MNQYVGRVTEFHLEPDGRTSLRIACPQAAVPTPGRYLLAHIPSDEEALLAEPLFQQGATEDGFLAAPLPDPLPRSWALGAEIRLRGPLGRAFALPGAVRNLALVAAGDTAARLLPLVASASSAALFTDLAVPGLPAHIEVQPLSGLVEALAWADFVAADVPLARLAVLQEAFSARRPAGQVLVTAPMPCGGIGECGVCSLKTGRKHRLLCIDGPVCNIVEVV